MRRMTTRCANSRNHADTSRTSTARSRSSTSASQLIDTMMNSYRDYGNPYTLFASAYSQFG
jgi:hypothetical protein